MNEPLPDHSSLTRIRERYGVEVFRRFFEAIVEQCQQAGLVWGRELYIDATKVEANAAMASVKPRFFVEAHLANLFATETQEAREESNQQTAQEEAAPSEPVEGQQQKSRCNFPSRSPRNSVRNSADRIPSAMTGLSSLERKIAG